MRPCLPDEIKDYAIIGASHIRRGVTDFAGFSKAMNGEFGKGVEHNLRAIFNHSKELHSAAEKAFTRSSKGAPEVALKRYKTGLERRTEAIKQKLEQGDFRKEQRQKTILDREAQGMRAQYQRLKDQFDMGVERDRLKNLPLPKKIIDTFVRTERAMKLTGITTLGKLGAAATTRLGTSLIEEGVGGILSKLPVLRKVAAAAPREGGFNLKAEIQSPTVGVYRGLKEIPSILKGDRASQSALYGKREISIKSALDIPGRIHGAIKSPAVEAERLRTQIKAEAHASKAGKDLSDPSVKEAIGKLAEQNAKRAIFMQDNVISNWWRTGIRLLETNKSFPTNGYILARVGNFLLPIVRVPTNVAIESGVHLGGLVTGTAKLTQVMARGLKTIKPEEADFIMRHYKKGLVGAGLFLTGYFNSDKLGGFYQGREKRKPGEVQWGQARVAGVTIPRWLLHAPAFIVMQAGATAHRVLYGKGGDYEKAGLAVAKGMTHEIPFMAELGVIDNSLADGYEGSKARGRLLSGSTIPFGLQNIAEWTDPKERRYPRSELDYVKMGVPGLREEVPYLPKRH